MPKPIIFGIIRSLHELFTAMWIGGILTMAVSFMPIFKKSKSKVKGLVEFLEPFQKRLGSVALISILGLWITGILLGRQSQAYSGFMSFATTYDVLLSIKHLLIFVMVLVAIYRRYVLGRKLRDFDSREQRLYGILLMVNAFFGISVVILSGISAAIG